MNSIEQKKEYSEQDILNFLEEARNTIKPREALVQSVLSKLETSPLPSPYTHRVSTFIYTARKYSLVTFAIAILVVGGIVYSTNRTSVVPQPLQNQQVSSGDTELDQDMANIDSELQGLDTDSMNADSALANQQS